MPKLRRFSGVIAFVLMWLVVLGVPSLRVLWQAQMTEVSRGKVVTSYNPEPPLAAAEHFSNDLRVQSALAQRGDHHERLRRYDALIAQHPQEIWLLLGRMRASTLSSLVPDSAIGDYLPADYQKAQSAYKKRQCWLSPEELRQSLRMAELGNQRDPQNAFFDWMRAAFYFAMEQPRPALAALRAGATKTRYDDGLLQEARNADAVLQLGALPLWEDRVMTSAALLFPHYALLRQTTRAALWQAILARRVGHEQETIQIFDALQRNGALMRHDANYVIGVLVATAIDRMVWSAADKGISSQSLPPRPPGSNVVEFIEQQRLANMQAFVEQARRVGQEPAAQFALQEFASLDGKELTQQAFGEDQFSVMGESRFFLAARWTGMMFLLCAASALCVWGVESVCLGWRRAPHGADDVTRTDALACALFALPALLVSLAAALMVGLGSPTAYFTWQSSVPEVEAANVLSVRNLMIGWSWLPLVLTAGFVLVASWWRGLRMRPDGQQAAVRNILKVIAFVLLTGAVAIVAVICSNELMPWQPQAFAMLCAPLVVLLVWAARHLLQWNPILRFLSGVLCAVGAAALFVAVVTSLSNLYSYAVLAWWQPSLSLLLCVPLMFLIQRWYQLRAAQAPRQAKASTIHLPAALEWHRRAAGTLVLIFSALYLLTSLAAQPARQSASVAFDQYLAKGETAIVREALAQESRTDANAAY